MKITGLKAVYPRDSYSGTSWRNGLWQIVVRVETDTGVAGLGYGGGGRASVEVVNTHFRELTVGREIAGVTDIADVWDDLYAASTPYGRKGIAIMALSGLDLALWDLLGKAQGRPVYDLISGMQKARVRAYATGPESARYRDLGFTAHKMSHTWSGRDADYDAAVESVARARRLFGPDALLMLDSYMSWDTEVTVEMARRLAGLDVYWFEDVLTPDLLDEQAALRPRVKPVLIAGGEHEFTHHGFAAVAHAGALDLWQPDITWCGGITAGLRILDLARDAGVPVVPHRGGEVWGLHLIAATACDDLAELLPLAEDDGGERLWIDEPEASDGYLRPLDRPGFGVTLNEQRI